MYVIKENIYFYILFLYIINIIFEHFYYIFDFLYVIIVIFYYIIFILYLFWIIFIIYIYYYYNFVYIYYYLYNFYFLYKLLYFLIIFSITNIKQDILDGYGGNRIPNLFPIIFWQILIPDYLPTSDKFRIWNNSSKNLPQNRQKFQKNMQNKYKEKKIIIK